MIDEKDNKMSNVKFAKCHFGAYQLIRSFVTESQECHDFYSTRHLSI